MSGGRLIPFPVKHSLRQRLAVSKASRGMGNAARRHGTAMPQPYPDPPEPRVSYRTCRWPLGEPGDAEFRFCEEPVAGRAGCYCEAHRAIAYVPKDPDNA